MKGRLIVKLLILGAVGWGCNKTPGEHALVDRKGPRAIVTDVMLLPKEMLVSKNFQRVQVFKEASYDLAFDSLIGPHPYTGSSIPDARAWFEHSEPRIHLEAGWVYAAGDCPYVEGGLVDATAHGSRATIIVWINESNGDVYTFLLNKTGSEWAKVSLRSDPSKNKQWDFKPPHNNESVRVVIFHPPATFDEPQPIDGPLQSFVADVKGFAADVKILDADH